MYKQCSAACLCSIILMAGHSARPFRCSFRARSINQSIVSVFYSIIHQVHLHGLSSKVSASGDNDGGDDEDDAE